MTIKTLALTPAQERVARPLVQGAGNQVIARQLRLANDSVLSQLKVMRQKLDCPGAHRRVLVHALLMNRLVATPTCARPAPDFTEAELVLLRALAHHSVNADIAAATRVPAPDVRAEIDALVAKACADDSTHLVGLAHAWSLLGPGPARGGGQSTASSHVPADTASPALA
ncbi:LuxR C-terminal-related transcriptional regulator [Streptomyces sp. NPDC050204]|uniref:LuxR C-terminal-related transcriptional regulator n=1 Tax=Streptomyces sp. NPDC050204 TaxID=3155514 RepID=UPI00342D4AD1